MNNKELNYIDLVNQALSGNATALESLIVEIKDLIYNLSVKMLFSREDAEDATQDIIIKIIKNLNQFKSKSKFTTWVYSIAKNYLLTARKKRAEGQMISFEVMSEDLNVDLSTYASKQDYLADDIIVADLKIGCTQAMLLCLDREKRIMFVLSKMFGINSIEGAEIFDITPQTYRKRLSRISEKMQNFIKQNCGLVNKMQRVDAETEYHMRIKTKE